MSSPASDHLLLLSIALEYKAERYEMDSTSENFLAYQQAYADYLAQEEAEAK